MRRALGPCLLLLACAAPREDEVAAARRPEVPSDLPVAAIARAQLPGGASEFTLTIDPPAAPRPARPRDVTLLLAPPGPHDERWRLRALKVAARAVLAELAPGDRVRVLAGGREVAEGLAAALREVDRTCPSGQPAPALALAPAASPAHVRLVVALGRHDGLTDALHAAQASAADARAFALVTDDVDPWTTVFARRARGDVVSVADVHAIDAAARELALRAGPPIFTDLELEWPGGTVRDMDPLPDLGARRRIEARGSYVPRASAGGVPEIGAPRLRGALGGEVVEIDVPMRTVAPAPARADVAALAAPARRYATACATTPTLFFEPGAAELPASDELAALAGEWRAHERPLVVEVVGHREPDEPRELGSQRAAAVRERLIAAGAAPELLVLRDAGPDELTTCGTSADERRLARRVEFRYLEPP